MTGLNMNPTTVRLKIRKIQMVKKRGKTSEEDSTNGVAFIIWSSIWNDFKLAEKKTKDSLQKNAYRIAKFSEKY